MSEENEYLWRQPGTRTLAEKGLELGSHRSPLRPQQVHVSLPQRFLLEAKRRILSVWDAVDPGKVR